jgi:hypothetical protein
MVEAAARRGGFVTRSDARSGVDPAFPEVPQLTDALVDSLTAFGPAVEPLPFPSPGETAVRMARRAALDQDPAEMWLRARIAEALAPRR